MSEEANENEDFIGSPEQLEDLVSDFNLRRELTDELMKELRPQVELIAELLLKRRTLTGGELEVSLATLASIERRQANVEESIETAGLLAA